MAMMMTSARVAHMLTLSAFFCGPLAERRAGAHPTSHARPAQEQSAPLEARPYPGLRIHREASPLAEDAITSDWPAFLGPARDAHSPETRIELVFPAEGPPLVWEMECGSGYSAPVVQGERLVYTHRVGDELCIDCLDATTGRRFWRHVLRCTYVDRYDQDNGPRSTPTIEGELVYVHALEGQLLCLELSGGRVVWQRDLNSDYHLGPSFFGVVSSPLVDGERLIVNLGAPAPAGPSVAAFDRMTGKLVWGAGRNWGASCASPVIATARGRRELFVLAGGDSRPPTGGLMVMDIESGELCFQYPFRSRTYESVNATTPVIGAGHVLISSSYGTGTSCIRATEEGYSELWNNRHLGFQFATPVFDQGCFFAIDGVSGRVGSLICLEPRSEQEVLRLDLEWQDTLLEKGVARQIAGSVGEGSLLKVDGHFLCLGDRGHLLSIEASPKSARVIARAALFHAPNSWTPLVLSRGLLYVCQNRPARFGTSEPRLLCYDMRASD